MAAFLKLGKEYLDRLMAGGPDFAGWGRKAREYMPEFKSPNWRGWLRRGAKPEPVATSTVTPTVTPTATPEPLLDLFRPFE